MKKIEVLDCTLRDGGYVNDNQFGFQNIKKIIHYLEKAGIDYIECGYLMDDELQYDKDKTEYRKMSELTDQGLLSRQEDLQYTLMLLGEKYQIENLPACQDRKNNIIRMSFHKKSLSKAIMYAKEIVQKGYRLFLQPTVIMSYTDEEIISMLSAFNDQLTIEGVAIVDTFGQMMMHDIVHLTKLFDNHLKEGTKLGFHSHNNLQTAFANAIHFIETAGENRPIVIDSSIYGMGRGAGNLPTELLLDYLNAHYGKKYDIAPILEANDTIIEKIKQKHSWGYNLAYYLSACYGCHPSYVSYLLNKKMLASSDINQVLHMVSSNKKTEYDENYISQLYQMYNSHDHDDTNSYQRLSHLIQEKEIVLIGPGKSIVEHQEMIADYIASHDCFVIAINNPLLFENDATFYSNSKRFQESAAVLEENDIKIVTSNIQTEEDSSTLVFDYKKSLSRKSITSDSALLMCLNILEQVHVSNVKLAGFDGFSMNQEKDFYCDDIAYLLDRSYIEQLNQQVHTEMKAYKKMMRIQTITPSKSID